MTAPEPAPVDARLVAAMTNPDSDSPDLTLIEALDAAFPRVAWRRLGVSDHDFMRRWTLQHRAAEDADVTLCGLRIQWHRVGSGDSRRCPRCDRAGAIALGRAA